MKRSINTLLVLSVFLLLNSCITQFIPKTSEDKQLLVVEGLITDQPEPYTIKLSRSLPLGSAVSANPVSGCQVTISDDLNNTYTLTETDPGIYVSDPNQFQGSVGRIYTLHINANNSGSITTSDGNLVYESIPSEMKPVPAIDSVYFEKVTIEKLSDVSAGIDGCEIYLNTHDPSDRCKFYRWEFDETWKFEIPYSVPNKICWVSDNSRIINIKNTSVFAEDRIERYPLYFISNGSDRLKVRYSILVHQYSLSEDEYNYWDKLQTLSEQVGGLYDVIPSAVSSNIFNTMDPTEKIQGYFSVSAAASKRIFISSHFAGQANPYSADHCIADTLFPGDPIPSSIGINAWIIISNFMPPYQVYTYSKGCYDCTVRGTNVKPDFWIENNK
jgi:Domain of unknown function (DUF4249)